MGFSGLVSGISNAIGAIGSALSGTAGTILTTVGALAAKLNPYINAIVTVIQVVGVVAKILKENEKVDEVGDKVLHAAKDGITLDSCDNNFEEYKRKIDEYQIDPNLTQEFSMAEKVIAGTSYIETGLRNSPCLRDIANLYPLISEGPAKDFLLQDGRIEEYANLSKELFVNIGSIKDYFEGTATTEDYGKVDNLLHTAEKKIDLEYSEADFKRELAEIRKEFREQE